MTTVISVENLSKVYKLGQIGTGTFANDLTVWWARMRGKPNPLLKIGQRDDGNCAGEEIWALKDVSFKVEQGEVLGIIGRNGAGKSTILKVLSRVTAPTSGKVKVKGRVASLLEVGTGFHPELTGRENVYLNGAILGMTRQEVNRKFDEIVSFAELEQFIDTPVKRYSSGMYVRLAFAVAAHLEPEILLVDEVLAVGDAGFQKKCLGKMGEVAQIGRTILFVSHNMDAINNLCNRAIWLNEGQIQEYDKINRVVELYINNYISKKPPSLVLRTDRIGNGEIRFLSCSLTNYSKKELRNIFFTGEPSEIILRLESKINTFVYIGLQVKDTMGKTITSFNSREGAVKIQIHEGNNKIQVNIPYLSLLEGNYSIDGAIIKAENAVSCDRINGISSFSVLPKDNFNAGASFRAYHGVVFIPHTWVIENQDKVDVIPINQLANNND
jgi:lipopolysaccharide transport system ATP-binding protein